MKSDATEIPQPWLEDSLEQLNLRKRDRCLVLSCPTSAHVGAVSRLVGRTATIVVVEPDLSLAELASQGKHEDLKVLNCTPVGGERFGTFDALLACPLTTMGWSLTLWADLILHNLRPGGRFVLDLPAETMCDPLRRAWERIGGAEEALEPISGPPEEEVANVLRRVGLRSVEPSMGTHLVTLESPYTLSGFLHGLWTDDGLHADLEIALVETLQTTREIDVVFQRTRVHGLR